jgi:ankyrin repeat protein
MTLGEEEFANNDDSQLLKQIKMQKWEVATSLISKDSASLPDIYGNLPIHAAIGYQAPESLILTLLKAYPQAAHVHGTDDWLPLHVAAMWGVSTDVMEVLIRQNPKALDDPGETGIKGRTPRHFSSRFAHNKELLERSTVDWIQLIADEKKLCDL